MISFIIYEHFCQPRIGGDDFFRGVNYNLDFRTDMRLNFSRLRNEHDANIPADLTFAHQRNENPFPFFQS